MTDPLDAITRWERTFERVSEAEQARRDAEFVPHKPAGMAKIVAVAYRCTRFLARARGLLVVEGLLCDVSDEEWTEPCAAAPPIASRDPAVMALHFLLKRTGPVALDLPAADTQERDDFVEAMTACAKALRIHECDATRPVVRALLSPNHLDDLWPPKDEILRFETALVESVWNFEVDLGGRETVQAMTDKMFVDPREAREFIRMARTAGHASAGPVNLEEERTVLLTRLERLYSTSLAALDLKTTRNCLKDQANILGLTRAAPDDLIQEISRTLLAIDKTPQGLEAPKMLEIPVEFRKPGGLLEREA